MTDWVEVAASRVLEGKPITEDLLRDMRTGTLSLRGRHVNFLDAQASQNSESSVYATYFQTPIFVPAGAVDLEITYLINRDEDPAAPSTDSSHRFIFNGVQSDTTPIPLTNVQVFHLYPITDWDTEEDLIFQARNSGTGTPSLYKVHMTITRLRWLE